MLGGAVRPPLYTITIVLVCGGAARDILVVSNIKRICNIMSITVKSLSAAFKTMQKHCAHLAVLSL